MATSTTVSWRLTEADRRDGPFFVRSMYKMPRGDDGERQVELAERDGDQDCGRTNWETRFRARQRRTRASSPPTCRARSDQAGWTKGPV